MQFNKSNIAYGIGILLIIAACFGAFNAHSKYEQSRKDVALSKQEVSQAQQKADSMINLHSKGAVYLMPKGEKQIGDKNYDDLNALCKSLFTFDGLHDFVTKANYANTHAQGSFMNYWLKGGINFNKTALDNISNGRNIKRFGDYTITRFDQNHYFVTVKTGLLIGDTSKSSVQPVLLAFDATRASNGKWTLTKISHFDSVNDPTQSSDADASNDN